MSLNQNNESLQEIIAYLNNLTDVEAAAKGIQRAAGTVTPAYTGYGGYVNINCGFKPDIVYLTAGYNSEIEGATFYSSTASAFTEEGVTNIESIVVNRDGMSFVELYTNQYDEGFEVHALKRYYDWAYEIYLEPLHYIAVKYVDGETNGVSLPTLANEGTSEDLMSGKQLIDADGNVVFGSYTPPIITTGETSTKLTSNNTTITFTGLTGEPTMFTIFPLGNITLGTTRYVTNVSYDGTTTHGIYGYRSGQSGTSYYSQSYFTWTYSNGTLTVKTSSTTNGGYFSSSVTYQLNYSTVSPSIKKTSGTFDLVNGDAVVDCGFMPDAIEISCGSYNGFTSNFSATFMDNVNEKYLAVYTENFGDWHNGYCYLQRTPTGFEINGCKWYTDDLDEWVVSDTLTYRAVKYT